MYEQLRELRGDMRKVHWEPGWVCECGSTTVDMVSAGGQ